MQSQNQRKKINYVHTMSFFLILGLMLAGCYTTPKKMDRLAIGMSRDEARHIMGAPFSAAKILNQETWIYHFWLDLDTPQARREPYEVVLVDEKVKRFGPATPLPKSLMDKSRSL